MNPVLFEPIYKERVWGGRTLETALHRKLPKGKIIGESWDVVDRAEENSPIRPSDGPSQTLRSLIETHTDAVMGPGWDPKRRFPVLVKWLDCRQRLSRQVHAPAPLALKLGGEPKTENWFVADTQPGASLIVGLKQGTTRDEFEKAIADKSLEKYVHRFPVEPGQSILVESGRLHAIDAGNLILEIQQNSDTTYRVYDWGRTGLDGRRRELHIDESMQCIDFDDFEPDALPTFDEPGEVVLADSSEFRIRRANQDVGGSFSFAETTEPVLLHVVAGKLSAGPSGIEFNRGDTALAPASYRGTVTVTEAATVLLTDRFV